MIIQIDSLIRLEETGYLLLVGSNILKYGIQGGKLSNDKIFEDEMLK